MHISIGLKEILFVHFCMCRYVCMYGYMDGWMDGWMCVSIQADAKRRENEASDRQKRQEEFQKQQGEARQRQQEEVCSWIETEECKVVFANK